MDTCHHYNGYQSGADMRVHRSSEWAVKKIHCPVCHAEIVVREIPIARDRSLLK
ncbi:MAG: hypothetical protein ABF629_11925 [Sporolactobacillus sp.]|uniref:hypothetical protein n=1 Tax=Sporolactobacillus sp. STSJ-5 TaxID=2965076 RepID=UPI00210453F0|nr:hypothetical protein [Sporolactobacillus sp. STSJ-5]MCQ2009859.1 hypothetical protein [Sporolactobacillus sp. STSJ-5]